MTAVGRRGLSKAAAGVRPGTVLDVCTERLGVHRGAIAAARVAQWALATADLGHVPTTVEYANWWAVTERTGWNHRSACRDVFGDDWPDVVEFVARQIGDRRSPREVMRLDVVTA